MSEKENDEEQVFGGEQIDVQTSAVSGKITLPLFVAAVVCFAGSSLQFGYNISVVNAPQNIIEDFFKDVSHFKSLWWPFAVSIFAIGGMFGAFFGPTSAKRIGRKKTLMVNNALAIVGGILLFCTKEANSVPLLIFGRIFVGLNAGVNTVVAPMYLSEIAPVRLRGSLGTLSQFGIVSGILLGNIIGLQQLLGNASGWPYAFGVTAIIGILQLCVLPFCPESPRYLLIIKNDEDTATKSMVMIRMGFFVIDLKKLRNTDDVSAEIEEMRLEAARESSMEHISVVDLFKDSSYHKPLLISVVMQLAQQLSGIGGILYYSTALFEDIGMKKELSQAATCGVGALSVVMTIVCIFLVEIKGRRFLMLLGLGGMGLLYAVVTVAFYFQHTNDASWAKYLGVVTTLLAVAAFQIGPGAIPWFIVAELFTQSSISAAISIAGPTNWLGNFIVGLLFPLMKDGMYPYTFIPFIILLALFVLFTYFVVPETKGLTVAEISAKLRNDDAGAKPNQGFQEGEGLLKNSSH